MEKIKSSLEIITGIISPENKNIIDIGCGTGELVRALNENGAKSFGIDKSEMIEKAKTINGDIKDNFICGSANRLTFEDNFADMICYIASFHHIPEDDMKKSVEECGRVLKSKGHVIFLEPSAVKDSYYELTKLVEDEKDILEKSYTEIRNIKNTGFKMVIEKYIYFERTFSDYENLINTFVPDEKARETALLEAKKITGNICRRTGEEFGNFRYKSICRLNVFKKTEKRLN